MSTIAAVIDRIFRTYLEPPDYQPVVAYLQSSINTTDQALTFGTFAVPEDSDMLRSGILIESPSGELMRVTTTNGTDVTVNRGRFSTIPASANAGDEFKFSPSFPRYSVFQSLRENIITLSPKLYTVKVEAISSVDFKTAALFDDKAIEIIGIWGDDWSADLDYHGRLVDFHPSTGGRTVIPNGYVGQMWVRYRRRMAAPDSETDMLVDLGVEDVWMSVLMAGVAADMLVGGDISRTHFNWVSEMLEAEAVPVGKRQDLGVRLAQYRDFLLRNFQKEMDVEYRPRVQMRNPFSQVAR